MDIVFATSTEMQNNFGRYLDLVAKGKQIVVTKNGKEVARFVGKDQTATSISRSLRGIVKDQYDLDDEKSKYLGKKYGIVD